MRATLCFALLWFSVAAGQAQQRISIEDAVRRGIAVSHPLRVSASRADAATARAGEARSFLLPSVKLEASYRRLSEVDPFRVQLPGAPFPVTISPVVLDNSAARLTVNQPLFTGFRLAANAASAERLAVAAREENAHDAADAALTAMTAYWALFQSREVKRAMDENVKRLDKWVSDGEEMTKAGVLTRGDLLKLQVQLSSAKLAALDAENDARLAEMNCSSLLGLPLDTKLELTSLPEDAGPLAPPPPSGREGSPDGRADVRAFAARVEAARAGVTAARGGWWPQLFLNGNAYYSRPNPRFMPTRDEWRGTWDVGVVLSMDLWNWGGTSRQVEQAEAALRVNEEALAQLREAAALEINRTRLQADRARERVALATLALEQARESQRIAQERHRAGTATPADLLDAGAALLQAETALTGARIEHVLAAARKGKAEGRLPLPAVATDGEGR